ncbi:hypothetical protein Tco_1110679 [Tanacetum coccineum]|uniref:Uncharacterized protein n=1 Tax=Tanacetum coccineum TaxID=301880 RepID=A0ABQ5IJG5_9ASTR
MLQVWIRMTRESYGLDDESHGLDDEVHGLDDYCQGLEDEGSGMEKEEEAAPEGQQQAVLVVDITASEPLEGADRISAFKQPILITWVDPEDGRVYTNILTYAPSAAPVQTLPSPEWSSDSLPVLPSSLVVPSPIASPVATPAATISVDEDHFLEVGAQLEIYRSILHDHTQCLDALPPTLFEGYDRDLRELYTRSGAVRDKIFSQRRQITKERRERLELTDRVARIERLGLELTRVKQERFRIRVSLDLGFSKYWKLRGSMRYKTRDTLVVVILEVCITFWGNVCYGLESLYFEQRTSEASGFYFVMSDSEDSTVTYTEVSSPMMLEDPYAFVEAALQAPPSPDYVPGPKHPPLLVYVPYVPEPVYPEFMPPEDDALPAEEQPLPTTISPTTDSLADYPTDRDDDDKEEEEDPYRDDVVDEEEDEDEDEEEEEHLASTDFVS